MFIVLVVVIFASILPDIPVLIFGNPGSIGYLAHRRYTNSLILAPFYSLIPIALFWSLIKKTSLKDKITIIYLFSLIAYLLHIFLDYITPFGTILFYPLNKNIYSLDLLHSFDPLFMLISFSIIGYFSWLFVTKKAINKNITKYFILLYFFYFCFTFVLKAKAVSEFSAHAKINYPETELISTVPRTFWRWRGILKSQEYYIVLLKENGKIKSKKYPIIKIPKIITQDSYYTDFVKYARYPIISLNKNELSVTNLIYSFDSYRLIFIFDNKGNIQNRKITGYDITDYDF